MRWLDPKDVADWVRDVLLDPARARPVVAVTTHPSVGACRIEPDALEAAVGKWADVVALETGEATWELAEALPERLDVFGGAMRVWWPGLTRESDPFDHELHLLYSPEDAERKVAHLVKTLRKRAGEPEDATPVAGLAPAPRRPLPEDEVVEVRVKSREPELLVEDAAGLPGRVTEADFPPAAIAVCVEVGQTLTVARPRGWSAERGVAPCSLRGRLPGPWDLVEAHLAVGDVVEGRVESIQDRFALVELVPGAKGIVFLSDIDPTFVRDIADVLARDELVPVEVVSVEAELRRARLSIKAARLSGRPRGPLPSLVPGGRPFQWGAFLERTRGAGWNRRDERDERDDRIEELEHELEAANEDRSALRRSLSDLKRELHSLQDRHDDLERRASGELDPLVDERAFLRAVRVAYAREVGEGERLERPLARMRVGGEFLVRARALQGIDAQKIVDVAAQVACGRAHEVDGREVHPLGESGSASRQRVRARDGAKAWRCSLQVRTPAARRLHWWVLPGADGPGIEFASVAVHDDYGIPE